MAALSLGSRGNGGGLHGTVPATLPPRSQRVINSCSPFAGAAAAGGSADPKTWPDRPTAPDEPDGASIPAKASSHPTGGSRGEAEPQGCTMFSAAVSSLGWSLGCGGDSACGAAAQPDPRPAQVGIGTEPPQQDKSTHDERFLGLLSILG
ncbi:uncharacterized protein LOC115344588 isoform X3 [Aquila chrysaetos chrysaetos]|uniref:uncharacterized protein LOC115344588 isoform X3 n=1 Tax=Aquila chrysaetos chrysaetos TaxID=223781 RepID=UPI0011771354|nr:uncharacterized protein LOC115344588 isoform X3 [Aquila chrysaetos chrysaetos]